MKNYRQVITDHIKDEMLTIRRDLHRNPELGWHEQRTAARIVEVLEQIGIRYRTGVAKTGVVAEIPAKKSIPSLR